MILAAQGPINPAEVVNQLLPNLWIFLAHLLATIMLLILITRWAYNPFRKAMRARRQMIKNIIDEARGKETTAIVNANKAAKLLTNAKTEALQIVSAAKDEAEEKKLIILGAAREEINTLNEHAKMSLVKEREASQEQIRKLVTEIAFDAAQAILSETIDTKKHKELINNFIKEI